MNFKNMAVAILLLAVFTVGTLHFTETVEAASWKKFDSGTYTINSNDKGFKNKDAYISYKKGPNNVKTKLYALTNSNKKVYYSTIYINKQGNTFKVYSIEYDGKKSNWGTDKYKISMNKYYKLFMRDYKKNVL